ncbi:MAG: glycosyltransferase family 39 protein [Candidatus Sulfopaludibacter sp.]|nr:glycosyltransferase family 39 protein [Candidatus Sulfopaludibacter sp.]
MLPGSRPLLLVIFALLAVLAYLPTLRQPLLEDDYPNLAIAQTYGAPAAWRQLADSVYRLRATSEWLMKFAYDRFGMNPAPYYAVSILLHVLNTWLVYALGAWPPVGYRISAWAALFFAVYEGHQEAVMWFSACNELLQFLFGVGAVVCWLHFQQGGRRRWWWYAGVLAGLALALVSKESAVVIAAMLAITAVRSRTAAALAPPLILAGACALSVYLTRDNSFRFQDGSFSLHAPFWRTWPENFARLFWVWGLMGAAAAWTRHRGVLWRGLLWAGIGLLPYSFLLYSARIPSRQLYLASAGVALVVGAGMAAVEKQRRNLAALACAAMLVHNTGYLWIRKRAQFLERAAPTERLIALAKRTPGPLYIQCFPRPGLIAEEAVHLGAGKPLNDVIWDAETAKARGAVTFCYAPTAAN